MCADHVSTLTVALGGRPLVEETSALFVSVTALVQIFSSRKHMSCKMYCLKENLSYEDRLPCNCHLNKATRRPSAGVSYA